MWEFSSTYFISVTIKCRWLSSCYIPPSYYVSWSLPYDFQCSTSVAMSLPSRYSRFHHQKLHTLAGSKLSGSRRVRSWERSLISASFETLIKPNVITKLKKKHNQSLDFKLEGMMKLEIRIFEIKHSIKQYLLKACNKNLELHRFSTYGFNFVNLKLNPNRS